VLKILNNINYVPIELKLLSIYKIKINIYLNTLEKKSKEKKYVKK